MEETAQLLTVEAAHEWGKLLFLGKDGQPAEHYTISKSTVVLGRSDTSPHLHMCNLCSGLCYLQGSSQGPSQKAYAQASLMPT